MRRDPISIGWDFYKHRSGKKVVEQSEENIDFMTFIVFQLIIKANETRLLVHSCLLREHENLGEQYERLLILFWTYRLSTLSLCEVICLFR